MKTLPEALDAIRRHSAGNLGEGASEAQIVAAEKKLGIAFPPSYRAFLKEIGYAELFGNEIYSIYDAPDDQPCLGIVQQNLNNEFLNLGYLAFFANDLDGVFYLNINDGSVSLNDPAIVFAASFADFEDKLLQG